jgi:diphosphoinositol-polyphosphate diphosphatase
MTTGCVPVVDGGKVLFISSSRKSEWILPKGGWEMDEAMEESAIRETFEEAGVLGILGPRLTEIEYETRKAKKRRLEYEEIQRKAKQIRAAHSPSPRPSSAPESTPPVAPVADVSSGMVPAAAESAHVDNEVLNRIRGQSRAHISDGETCSVASEASQSYTHVRMTLFPLYVTDIRRNWPEQGRFRKAVDIDEAIRLTESRPEFQAALKELKDRNLHMPQQYVQQPKLQTPQSRDVVDGVR